jgi:hypothetical protein
MTTKMGVPTVVNVLGVLDRGGVETVALKLPGDPADRSATDFLDRKRRREPFGSPVPCGGSVGVSVSGKPEAGLSLLALVVVAQGATPGSWCPVSSSSVG